MKRLLVASLSRACELLDHFGCLGCRLNLASMSADLDERWNTGVWVEVGGDE